MSGRIRTIKPEFPQSETVGKLSRDARLLFIQLWTIVDDSGRARANSRLLASLLYPYDADAPDLIDGWLDELEANECVRRYEVGGSHFLDLPNWLKHQKIEKPTASKLPPFGDNSGRPRRKVGEESTTDLGPRTKDQDRDQTRSLRSRDARAREEADLDAEFEAKFWPAYPHRVGRADALVAFRRARRGEAAGGKPARSPVALERILHGVARYVSNKPPDRQWLNPATFLNGEHYDDEPASAPIQNGNSRPANDALLDALVREFAPSPGDGGRPARANGRHDDQREGAAGPSGKRREIEGEAVRRTS